ncbi:MAG: sialate O-acetylesterase [Planctomycetales bacterium]
MSGERIALLKYAVGGTSMDQDWFADGTSETGNDGVQYREFKKLVNAGLAGLENDYPEAEINVRALLWHQGEADVGSAAMRYKPNMQEFIRDLREDLGEPGLPVLIGGLSDLQREHYQKKNRLKWFEMITSVQKELSADDPMIWFVSLEKADGMTIGGGGLHFDRAGYMTMGRRFAEVYLNGPGAATSRCYTAKQETQTPAENFDQQLSYDIPPRATPLLTEKTENLRAQAWLSEDLKKKGVELTWVKSIWGKESQNWYNHWDDKISWARGVNPWYMTHPRIIWFKGQMYGALTQRSLPHGSADTIAHLINGESDCKDWKSVVHYEVEGGVSSTHFVETSDGQLMFVGLRKEKGYITVAAFSKDGINWSALKEFKTDSDYGPIGQIFKLARHDGKVYGLSRTGKLWQSRNGIDYEPIKVIEPADGYVGENETASTFVGNKWLIFQRAGMVAEADPPYSHWTLWREGRAQLWRAADDHSPRRAGAGGLSGQRLPEARELSRRAHGCGLRL